jgi:hypothetical protein
MPKASAFSPIVATSLLDADAIPIITNAGDNRKILVSEARMALGPGYSDTVPAHLQLGATRELKIQAAIDFAFANGRDRVFVATSLLPYNPALVTFRATVQMVREGGAFDVYDVQAYGATGNGVVDDLLTFQAAIDGARTTDGRVFVPGGIYAVSGAIVLGNATLAFVPLYGSGQNVVGAVTQIIGNLAGPILQIKGTSLAAALNAGVVRDLSIKNTSTDPLACCVETEYSSCLCLESVEMEFVGGAGLRGSNFSISTELHNVTIYGFNQYAGSRNITGGFYNLKIFGGRLYGGEVAIDIGGESLLVVGANSEFIRVFFRHGAMVSATFIGVHVEEFDVLHTNAYALPISAGRGTPWVDGGGNGAALLGGAIMYIACRFLPSYTDTDHVVIKSEGGFHYALSFQGCTYTGTLRHNSVFTYNTNAALPVGTTLEHQGYQGTARYTLQTDAFSKTKDESLRAYILSEITIPTGYVRITDAYDGASGNAYAQFGRPVGYKTAIAILPVAGEPGAPYASDGNVAWETDRGPLCYTNGGYWNGMRRMSTAMPTSGTYKAGDEVHASAPAEAGTGGSKYIITGWKRMTTGAAHVLNTDWMQMRTLTGN